MRVVLTSVSKGRDGAALPPTDAVFASGQARLAVAETEQRPTVLGLIASGRMRPDAGDVEIDGRRDAAASGHRHISVSAELRRRVALVDAPGVSDPAPDVTVAGVVAEELMFAGRRSTPLAARRWLVEHGCRELSRTPISGVQPSRRIRLLLELALLRPGVDGVVLVSPDRHGGSPEHWWAVVEEIAARGVAVLAIAGAAAASVLDVRAPRADVAADAPAPSPQPTAGPKVGPATRHAVVDERPAACRRRGPDFRTGAAARSTGSRVRLRASRVLRAARTDRASGTAGPTDSEGTR